jgi:hypothetical protein
MTTFRAEKALNKVEENDKGSELQELPTVGTRLPGSKLMASFLLSMAFDLLPRTSFNEHG